MSDILDLQLVYLPSIILFIQEKMENHEDARLSRFYSFLLKQKEIKISELITFFEYYLYGDNIAFVDNLVSLILSAQSDIYGIPQSYPQDVRQLLINQMNEENSYLSNEQKMIEISTSDKMKIIERKIIESEMNVNGKKSDDYLILFVDGDKDLNSVDDLIDLVSRHRKESRNTLTNLWILNTVGKTIVYPRPHEVLFDNITKKGFTIISHISSFQFDFILPNLYYTGFRLVLKKYEGPIENKSILNYENNVVEMDSESVIEATLDPSPINYLEDELFSNLNNSNNSFNNNKNLSSHDDTASQELVIYGWDTKSFQELKEVIAHFGTIVKSSSSFDTKSNSGAPLYLVTMSSKMEADTVKNYLKSDVIRVENVVANNMELGDDLFSNSKKVPVTVISKVIDSKNEEKEDQNAPKMKGVIFVKGWKASMFSLERKLSLYGKIIQSRRQRSKTGKEIFYFTFEDKEKAKNVTKIFHKDLEVKMANDNWYCSFCKFENFWQQNSCFSCKKNKVAKNKLEIDSRKNLSLSPKEERNTVNEIMKHESSISKGTMYYNKRKRSTSPEKQESTISVTGYKGSLFSLEQKFSFYGKIINPRTVQHASDGSIHYLTFEEADEARLVIDFFDNKKIEGSDEFVRVTMANGDMINLDELHTSNIASLYASDSMMDLSRSMEKLEKRRSRSGEKQMFSRGLNNFATNESNTLKAIEDFSSDEERRRSKSRSIPRGEEEMSPSTHEGYTFFFIDNRLSLKNEYKEQEEYKEQVTELFLSFGPLKSINIVKKLKKVFIEYYDMDSLLLVMAASNRLEVILSGKVLKCIDLTQNQAVDNQLPPIVINQSKSIKTTRAIIEPLVIFNRQSLKKSDHF